MKDLSTVHNIVSAAERCGNGLVGPARLAFAKPPFDRFRASKRFALSMEHGTVDSRRGQFSDGA